MNSDSSFLKALNKESLPTPPIWYMRQAGRYMPEYQNVRKKFKNSKKPLVIISGCVAQAESKEMLKREPYIDMVVGPQSYHKITDLILNHQRKKEKINETEFDGYGNENGSVATEHSLEGVFVQKLHFGPGEDPRDICVIWGPDADPDQASGAE